MGRTRRIAVACALVVASVVSALAIPAAVAESTTVDVRTFGAMGNGVADDTAAVQLAMDYVAAFGGGRVFFPQGTYRVRSLFLASAVELYGNGDAVLKNIDPHRAIVYAESLWTTGSIAKGSKSLRIANPHGVRTGLPVAIRDAGRYIEGQTTTTPIHYSKVESINVNDVAITHAALATVSDAEVWFGITGAAIRGLQFDGSKSEYTKPTAAVPIDLWMAGRSIVANNVVRNGVHGGIRLDLGSFGNLIENNRLVDNGRPKIRMGAAIWLFRGARKNTIRGNKITGETYQGIAVDDRTEEATDWDAASNSNTISKNVISVPAVDWNSGIYVGGSSTNLIERNRVTGVTIGLTIDKSGQGLNGRDAKLNVVRSNALRQHGTGIYVTGSRNSFRDNTISSATNRVIDWGKRNSFK